MLVHNIVKYFIGYWSYFFRPHSLIVNSIEDTLVKLRDNRCSIGRFGDGEIEIINRNAKFSFQKNDLELRKELQFITSVKEENYLLGIPDFLKSMKTYTFSFKAFWLYHYKRNNIFYLSLNNSFNYYNAHISRPFYGRKSDIKLFNCISNLWLEILAKRDILIIEGFNTKFGIGNNLLSNANSVKRILCPQKNAYDYKNDILNKIESHVDKDTLVLLALGPTATVLSYHLHRRGYQAIDIGSYDIEYSFVFDKKNVEILSNGYFRVKNKFNHGVDNPSQYTTLDYMCDEVLLTIGLDENK
jgi:glycosyltransferase family protein